MTTVRYFAAAAEAAETEAEERGEATLAELRTAILAEHPKLWFVLPDCAVLVDGVRTDGDTQLEDARLIDVLPPFAGG
ncbi:MoaD/ThiS family protein [Microbacterium dauci]|uniref:MoaD/ThiS family protein n=1 Tax=Microbacterium dauci TaxID=3048008 RepID=A0ABT6ZFI6_9MICO|nr:MoaD/ThiS family protein [Microbacterium sp. LX3-4]MDJ1114920.1 MoaD/ThiS family protein [Microbacterium sp. LX3-4]